jgi:hypothetical protein
VFRGVRADFDWRSNQKNKGDDRKRGRDKKGDGDLFGPRSHLKKKVQIMGEFVSYQRVLL